ncbi:hypothetical protein WISP_76364 [Willisornis vidua]|uniref:Uncharacterized protein n=1 Tax=Willisornis vidua TaxID=1566151 RepID=A0ABQ9DC40_9PASS|nr:hypothetical protein WISP_76364 [Willisornis vidua]
MLNGPCGGSACLSRVAGYQVTPTDPRLSPLSPANWDGAGVGVPPTAWSPREGTRTRGNPACVDSSSKPRHSKMFLARLDDSVYLLHSLPFGTKEAETSYPLCQGHSITECPIKYDTVPLKIPFATQRVPHLYIWPGTHGR